MSRWAKTTNLFRRLQTVKKSFESSAKMLSIQAQNTKLRKVGIISGATIATTKLRKVGIISGATIATTIGVFVLYAESEEKPRKKLVILGSGWGAVSLLKSLKPGDFDVAVISPENYFLFTPLLPSVTVGTVEGRSITEPIRRILAKKHKHAAKFYEAECMEVDVAGNKVMCRDLSGI